MNKHTTGWYFRLFRQRIADYQEQHLKRLSGHIEIDESYFGSRHFGDKRGRGAKWRIPIIGILKRKGMVYTRILPDVSKSSILPIIKRLISKSKSNVYTDKWRSYDGLILQDYKHYRINHWKEFVAHNHHINGIESFWSYVKRKMRKHNGIPRNQFYLYLKESEFRFNNRSKDIFQILTKAALY